MIERARRRRRRRYEIYAFIYKYIYTYLDGSSQRIDGDITWMIWDMIKLLDGYEFKISFYGCREIA